MPSFLVLLLAGSVTAHIGGYIYPIPEIPDQALDELDVRDGNLYDWEDVGLYPVLTAMDFVTYPKLGDKEGVPYNPSDLDYRVWLGWNGSTSRLYFALERIDDIFINEYAGGNLGDAWRHDGYFEFMVDGDHSGGAYHFGVNPDWTEEERILNNNRTAQRYMGIMNAPDDQYLSYGGGSLPGNQVLDGAQWVTLPPYADASGSTSGEAPVFSIFECFVTLFDDLLWNDSGDSKPSALLPGKIIGFSVTMPDFDAEPGRYRAFHALGEPYLGTADDFVPGMSADHFVDGRLVGVQGETHVESVTWARIKASFR